MDSNLKVDHQLESLPEGQDVVLTLKDTDVLDQEAPDVLENSGMQDRRRLLNNQEKKKELQQNV